MSVLVPTRGVGTWGLSSAPQAVTRLNVGCGNWPLVGWTNLDTDPAVGPDVVASVPPVPYPDDTLDEIYAGHILEHLDPATAAVFLSECWRCLHPGGRLGVVVPDTREILTRYLAGTGDRVEYPGGRFWSIDDLESVCALFLYSTVQPSRHQWSYDATTLRQRIETAGFEIEGPIDRLHDPRIPVGAWYQCGWDARKP